MLMKKIRSLPEFENKANTFCKIETKKSALPGFYFLGSGWISCNHISFNSFVNLLKRWVCVVSKEIQVRRIRQSSERDFAILKLNRGREWLNHSEPWKKIWKTKQTKVKFLCVFPRCACQENYKHCLSVVLW